MLGSSQVGANSKRSQHDQVGKRPPTMDNDKDTDKRRQQHDNYDEDDKDEAGMWRRRDRL